MHAQRPDRTRRAGNIASARDAVVTNAPGKQFVSAAGVFKKPRLPTRKKAQVTPKKNAKESRMVAAEPPSPQKPQNCSARSSSASPQKEDHGKKLDMHPLALSFKGASSLPLLPNSQLTTLVDASTDYRTHLYKITSTKLSTTLSTLINSLHTCNLAAISSPRTSSDPNASPIKLTLSAKYDRATEKAFCPISDYEISNVLLHPDGRTQTLDSVSLKEMLIAFEEKTKKEVEEIRALEAQWEQVVGEIYKTGVACLGHDTMRAFLVEPGGSSASLPRFVTEEESLLLAPKKRVTFQEPRRKYPSFLDGPSMYKNHPIATLPALPEDVLQELEDAVDMLGVKQVEELRKIEADQSKWWGKKCELIAQTLRAE
jgi:hypothetical protein